MTRRPNPLEGRARELALAAGLDPDARVAKLGSERGMPAWCRFTEAARAEQNKREAAEAAVEIVNLRPQEKRFQNRPSRCLASTTRTRSARCGTAWRWEMPSPA